MAELTPWENRFRVETWTEYAVGLAFILLRVAARVRKAGGFVKLQADDWIALQTIIWFTLLVVSINKIVFGGGSNFMTPEEEAALTPETKADRIDGSKWVLVSEQSMIMCVWSCKAIMLMIYRTLTAGLKQERWIKAVAVYTVLGFLATQITLFTACRPFSGYWSVPPISTQCWSYWHFEYVQGTFNITADILMLLVSIPVIAKVKLPWLQKAPLLGVFGLGLLVIIAAVLTKVYCLVPALLSYEYLAWYHREVALSITVTMLPVIWAFYRDMFPALRNWGYKTETGSHNYASQTNTTRDSRIKMRSYRRSSDGLRGTDSEERIVRPLEINKHTTFSVEESFMADDNERQYHGNDIYAGPKAEGVSVRVVARDGSTR